MSQILLGLYDGYMSASFDSLTSETKIGGRATFFPPLSTAQHARIKEWTTCGVCGHGMYLLVQAYSPLPSAAGGTAHHRMLYVFACNTSSCARQPSSSWTAFSLQVNRDDDEDADGNASEEAEAEDLTKDGTQPLPASALPPCCFPPCHVYIDAEPAKAAFVPTALEKELIAKAEKRLSAETPDDEMTDKDIKELEETVDLKDKRSDYLYEKFRARVARAPTQVLRYHQRVVASAGDASEQAQVAEAQGTNTESSLAQQQQQQQQGQRPIFMNPDKVKHFVRVPACTHCGAALVHELQVMPTSLYYLRVSEYAPSSHGGVKHSRQEARTTSQSAKASTALTDAEVAEARTAAKASSAPTTASAAATTSEDGLDFATATVYACGRDCALAAGVSASTATTLVHAIAPSNAGSEVTEDDSAATTVVVLRREFVCVESPPTLEEEKQEKKREERARAGGAVRKDFREMLEAVESEEEDDDDEKEGKGGAKAEEPAETS